MHFAGDNTSISGTTMTIQEELLKHDVIGIFEIMRVADATGNTMDDVLDEASKLTDDGSYRFRDGEFHRQ
jgi:hypothetical protein